MEIKKIQDVLEKLQLAGWLLTDYQHMNVPATRFLHLDSRAHISRRWFYWIPVTGVPVQVVHAVEPHVLNHLPGKKYLYISRKEMIEKLSSLKPDTGSIAIEISPECKLPTVSRVDAGIVELLNRIGFTLVSSADLLQFLTALWTDEQIEYHREAAEKLMKCMTETFKFIKGKLHEKPTEYEIQQFILDQFNVFNMETSHPPICAFDNHTALPHFEVAKDNSIHLEENMPILIDMWARLKQDQAIYADITWMAYTGSIIPEKFQHMFDVVIEARDTALNYIIQSFRNQQYPTGASVDRICRNVIKKYGFEKYFVHRTGHSLGEDVHGPGTNLDSLESEDDRMIISRTGFTIEPGIYIKGEYGVRSEINVMITPSEAIEVTGKVQREIILLKD